MDITISVFESTIATTIVTIGSKLMYVFTEN